MGATDRDWYFEDATIKSAIELTRYLMEKYHIPVDNVLRHYDVTGKICPNPLVYNHTKYTWAGIKAALIAKETMPEKPQPTELYRIRKSWSNKKSQLGAYKSLSKAKANCPAGYKVFSRNGNVVYTKKKRKSPVSVKHSPAIKAWQEAVLFDGFNLPSGATGEWSKECDMVARKALVGISTTPVSKVFHRVVVAQNLLNNYGFPCGKADGQCGKNTLSAIKAFQNAHSLTSDGIIGLDTWKKLLGVA